MDLPLQELILFDELRDVFATEIAETF